MSAWTYRRLMARPPERLFHLVFESHTGRAPVPSPKRSASPRATSTLQWRIGLKALDPERPIREADIDQRLMQVGFGPRSDIDSLVTPGLNVALRVAKLEHVPPRLNRGGFS